jgi:hypothetical protein
MKVTNITPRPIAQTFEVSLTDQDVALIGRVCALLTTHREAIAVNVASMRVSPKPNHVLRASIKEDLERVISLLDAFTPQDPLSEDAKALEWGLNMGLLVDE